MNTPDGGLFEILKVVAQGGVVAIIAFYALYAIGGKIDKLTDAVAKLHTKIAVLLDREAVRDPKTPHPHGNYDSEIRRP